MTDCDTPSFQRYNVQLGPSGRVGGLDGTQMEMIHSILQLVPLGSVEPRQSKSHGF